MVAQVILAGTHSGVGKTTLVVGLIAALRRRGLVVQPFKVGPDYIDPTHHSRAADRPCHNLDTWLVPADRIGALFQQSAHGADVALIEGVMGLYDGVGYDSETASTAEVAKLLGAPVILVVDASRMARIAAALVLGYQRFDPEVRLAGVIVNRVGSPRHGAGVAAAITDTTGLPVLGCLLRDEQLKLPERHLGLVPTAEAGNWRVFAAAAGGAVERALDLDLLLRLTAKIPSAATPSSHRHEEHNSATRPVLAVAQDEAFHFTYEANLAALRRAGADLAFFSPLHDRALPAASAGVLLSGGFPEIYARALAENGAMLAALRQAHARGLPIYAECGGLMILTEAIVDFEQRRHPLVGLLPGQCVMTRKLALGYRLAEAAGPSWLFERGEQVHGHEFHYSAWEGRPATLPPAYLVRPASSQGAFEPEGACLGNLWASYVHLHFWGKPDLAARLVAACRDAASGMLSRGRACTIS
jgi:cobyrinic acid a,c-diamide synthase